MHVHVILRNGIALKSPASVNEGPAVLKEQASNRAALGLTVT